MKPFLEVLALAVALGATGFAVVFTQSQAPAVPAGVPNISGTFAGRRCVPANSDVCPEMNAQGAERLMTARGKAFIAAFDEPAAPKYDCIRAFDLDVGAAQQLHDARGRASRQRFMTEQ